MRTMIMILLMSSLCYLSVPAADQTMTLDSALQQLLEQTTRGRIIAGQHQVAQDKFDAEKIGYYLPEISLNTTLPTYAYTEDYNTYPGFTDPILFKRNNIGANGNIRMRQKVLTGGDVTFETRVNARNDEYPSGVYGADNTFLGFETAIDKRRLANLYLQFNQPLFQTSETRSAYYQARDNLNKADIEYWIAQADLKKEGITAYFDLLIARIDRLIAENESQLSAYNAKWDSVKFTDSVITEEAWIESKSDRLEKQLAAYDAEANLSEKTNNFIHLLDLPVGSDVELAIPPVPPTPSEARTRHILADIDNASDVQLAWINMEISERNLGQTRSSLGVNGTLNASYSIGQGKVTQSKPDRELEENIDTKDWQVSLNLSYPIWDGGASKANLHSQELSYESARLEYLAAQRRARNNLEILLRRIQINHDKLSLLLQEVDLAKTKLDEAEGRFSGGMISEAALLENRNYYEEARKSLMTTMKDHYLDLTDLEKSALP
jgi:outer membrane protein TolC